MGNNSYIPKNYENILVSEINNDKGLKVILIQINRPKALNALNSKTLSEISYVLEETDKNDEAGCSIITGSDKAFAAGADIKEMSEASAMDMYIKDLFGTMEKIRTVKKPFIAAVSGFALGGGCELAMACDIIIASETAKFGQPEINLGVIPGMGGTQRLTKAIGKARAMEMILTGKLFKAQEMFDAGLLTKVVPEGKHIEEATVIALDIASKPMQVIKIAKECILKAFDTTLETGIEYEKKNFFLLFSGEDKKEGMKAFIEKRNAEWKHK